MHVKNKRNRNVRKIMMNLQQTNKHNTVQRHEDKNKNEKTKETRERTREDTKRSSTKRDPETKREARQRE